MATINNECVPLFEEEAAVRLTGTATGGCTGCRGVKLTGPRGADGTFQVALSTVAGARPFGYAAYDVTTGQRVEIIKGSGTILPLEAGAAIAAVGEVEIDGTGRVIAHNAGTPVGQNTETAGAAGALVMVDLY